MKNIKIWWQSCKGLNNILNLYSLTFIYLFLPLSVLVYYATPKRAKNAILVLISLSFYTMAEPKYLPLMVGSVLFDYCASRLIESFDTKEKVRKVLMLFVLIKNALLVILLSSFTQNRELWRPLGVMIYAITSLGYTLDVYKRETQCEHNLIDFALFCVLYVKLPAGPLVRWNELRDQIKDRRPSLSMISDGVVLYIQGLAKKVIIGSTMTSIYDRLAAFTPSEQSVVSSWLMTAALAFAIYFNLSSLCDMARGLAKIYSIELPRNFCYPYQSRSITEFVSRFNITVSNFFRAYLPERLRDAPLTGTAMVLNIGIVTLFWGVWFGFRVNFIIWGLYFVLFQLLEQLGLGTTLKKIPVLFSRLYTFAVVLLSFVIFAGNNVDQSIRYFTTMLGLGNPKLYTDPAMYIASSNYILLILACIFCTNLASTILAKLRKKVPVFSELLSSVLNAVLLLLSTAFLLV